MQNNLTLQKNSDLDLILSYQKNHSKISQSLLYDRHKGLVYRYALHLYGELYSKGICITVEDLVNDYIEQMFLAFTKIDDKRVKNKEKFSTSGILINRFNSYTKVIRRRYLSKYHVDNFDFCDVDENDSIPKKYSKIEINLKTASKENSTSSILLAQFKNSLKTSIEYNCFGYLQEGYKGKEISKKLHITEVEFCKIKKKLKKKFKEFCDIN